MTNLEQAGGKVIPYVDTAYGADSLATVETNIDTYITQYGKLIDGFFLDEVNAVPGTLAYYQALNRYIRGLNWFESVARSHIENIVCAVPDAGSMTADLAKAVQLNAGQIFITDQGANKGNPYGQLPSYWTQDVSAVAAVPEPGTAALGIAGFAWLCAARLRRRNVCT